MKRLTIFIVLSAIFTVALYVVPISLSWIPYSLMDLNDNGVVSFGEAFFSMDLGVRTGRESGCTEIFFLKDASTIKTICDG